jgi:hypothetical protein
VSCQKPDESAIGLPTRPVAWFEERLATLHLQEDSQPHRKEQLFYCLLIDFIVPAVKGNVKLEFDLVNHHMSCFSISGFSAQPLVLLLAVL